MDQAENHDILLARWMAGELSPEELEELRGREDYDDLQAILHELEQLEMPPFSEEESWQTLQQKRNTLESVPDPAPPVSPHPPKGLLKVAFTRRTIMAVAAVLLALVVALFWLNRSDDFRYGTEITTAKGEQQKITLPDGSTVQLNATSRLGFTESEWETDRVAGLEGEGYFRARKGSLFTVHTKQGEVSVVGTVFNVYAREQELEVKCLEGKVQVINPKGTERVLLKANEQVSVINGKMQNRRKLDFSPKWFDGVSTFRSASLPRVFGEMERQFGITITGKELSDRSFSGKFVHKDLQKALKMVCDPMDLSYRISGDTVMISQ